jgi:malate dehydrogenase (oxaloacetate-decarboxylating)(NADP+)
MKVAAAHAIAELAREPVPHEVVAANKRDNMEFGREYIIPSPFDPRLISRIPVAVAKAAIASGVARNKITDWAAYEAKLAARLNPTANTMENIVEGLIAAPKTVVFAEGEAEKIIRAALEWKNSRYGNAILVGDESRISATLKKLGAKNIDGISIKAGGADNIKIASDLVNNGEGDVVITGLTKSYHDCLVSLMNEIGAKDGERVFGVTIAVGKHNEAIFISDTAVHIKPNSKQLATIAKSTAALAKKMGQEPRAALLSFSNFGSPDHEGRKTIQDALKILHSEKVDFEVDGDITPDVALESELLKLYPNAKLTAPANCLIMPSLEASNISGKMLHQIGGSTLIGPILVGFKKPAQIIPNGSTVSEILNIAAIGAAS